MVLYSNLHWEYWTYLLPLCQVYITNYDILHWCFSLCDWFSLRWLVSWIFQLPLYASPLSGKALFNKMTSRCDIVENSFVMYTFILYLYLHIYIQMSFIDIHGYLLLWVCYIQFHPSNTVLYIHFPFMRSLIFVIGCWLSVMKIYQQKCSRWHSWHKCTPHSVFVICIQWHDRTKTYEASQDKRGFFFTNYSSEACHYIPCNIIHSTSKHMIKQISSFYNKHRPLITHASAMAPYGIF